jgi:hypothetical protein
VNESLLAQRFVSYTINFHGLFSNTDEIMKKADLLGKKIIGKETCHFQYDKESKGQTLPWKCSEPQR